MKACASTTSSYSFLVQIHKKSSTIIITWLKKQIVSDPPILKAHNNTDIILRLPMGKRIKDIRWLSVWCRRFTKALWTKQLRHVHFTQLCDYSLMARSYEGRMCLTT
uniref:DM13 domain-containing protein n=1 Tax=Glossina morsitans morsitans TaxID=37546 RepID=A0A1B0G9U7_GLOMM